MQSMKWMKASSLLFLLVGLGFFWGCNVSEPTTTTSLNLKLYDSLSKDQGLYDSVRVDILDGQDSVVIRGIFHGEYLKSRDSAKLADLSLGTNPPNPLKVVIHAYKGDKEALEVVIHIQDKVADDPIASVIITPIPDPVEKDPDSVVVKVDTITIDTAGTDTSAIDTAATDTLVVTVDSLTPITSLQLKRNLPKLFVGGPAFPLEWTHSPDSLKLVPVIQSSDEGVVQVVGRSIKAVSVGLAIVTVSAEGFPLAKDTLQIPTFLDKPKIDAGMDQNVAVGQTVTFNAKVTQEYGSITLSWDFNGDNTPEGVVTTDTASATYTFNTAGEYFVTFTAEDSEGNITTLTRRIRVGLPGPLVEITSPSRHTFTNTRTAIIPVEWLVNGNIQTTQLTQGLTKEGAWNLIRREFTDSLNQVSFDTVSVFWDTTTPKIAFTNLKNGDIITTASTPVAWTVDQIAQSTQASETFSGSEGPKTISRSFTDSAGNIGTATVQVLWDRTAPMITIDGQANRIVNVTAITLTGTASDSTSGIKSIVISGAATGNGSAAYDNAASTWTKTGLTLAEGPNTLTVTTTDNAGWTKTSIVQVTLDTRKPGAPVWSSLTPNASRTPTLTWTWTKANNDGNARFVVRRNNVETDVGTATTYSVTATIDNSLYGLEVKEVDSIAGDGPWTTVRNILYDSKAPNPGIAFVASPTKAPRWNFTSDGGVGTFRWHFQGQAPGSAGTGANFFAPTNLGNGRHTLCVQELDSPEWGTLWAGTNCSSIDVDTTRPVIANLKPSTGFVTNQGSVSVTFTQDGVPKSFNCALKPDDFTDCDTTVTDLAGNSQTVSTRIWSRPKVIFVKAGALNGNGSSWDNALGSISEAIDAIGSRTGRVEIWISEGTYQGFSLSRSQTSLYGGFKASGYPKAIEDRDLSVSISRIRPDSNGNMVVIQGNTPVICRDAAVNGFHIFDEVGQVMVLSQTENAVISDFWIESNRNTGGAGLVAVTYGDAEMRRVFIRDNYSVSYSALYLYSGGKLNLFDSEITNNSMGHSWGSAGILNEYGGAMTIRNTKLFRNSGGLNYQIYNHNGGLMDIDQCTIQNGRNGVYPETDPEGNLIKWGLNNISY